MGRKNEADTEVMCSIPRPYRWQRPYSHLAYVYRALISGVKQPSPSLPSRFEVQNEWDSIANPHSPSWPAHKKPNFYPNVSNAGKSNLNPRKYFYPTRRYCSSKSHLPCGPLSLLFNVQDCSFSQKKVAGT